MQPWITEASIPGVSGPAACQFVLRRSASMTACGPGPDEPGPGGARPSARVTAPGQEITPSMSAGLSPASPIASRHASSVSASTPRDMRRPTSDWPTPEMMQRSSKRSAMDH